MKSILIPCFRLLSLCAAVIFSLPSTMAQTAELRPGDKIELRIGGVPIEDINAVSSTYTVDAEGFINLPHIGRVRASGLQQHQLQLAIESAYKSAQIYTRPTITINHQVGDRFVNVDGEVRARQRVPYTSDMTFLSAINAAGGMNEFADGSRVQHSRGGKTTTIDVRKIRKNASLDFKVLPGDNIYVPRSFF